MRGRVKELFYALVLALVGYFVMDFITYYYPPDIKSHVDLNKLSEDQVYSVADQIFRYWVQEGVHDGDHVPEYYMFKLFGTYLPKKRSRQYRDLTPTVTDRNMKAGMHRRYAKIYIESFVFDGSLLSVGVKIEFNHKVDAQLSHEFKKQGSGWVLVSSKALHLVENY